MLDLTIIFTSIAIAIIASAVHLVVVLIEEFDVKNRNLILRMMAVLFICNFLASVLGYKDFIDRDTSIALLTILDTLVIICPFAVKYFITHQQVTTLNGQITSLNGQINTLNENNKTLDEQIKRCSHIDTTCKLLFALCESAGRSKSMLDELKSNYIRLAQDYDEIATQGDKYNITLAKEATLKITSTFEVIVPIMDKEDKSIVDKLLAERTNNSTLKKEIAAFR